MNNSVQIKPTSERRVGMSNGQIVILDFTMTVNCGCSTAGGTNNVYHGHVRSDFKTATAMSDARKALKNAIRDGKIIP